jgi:hypothetical protein
MLFQPKSNAKRINLSLPPEMYRDLVFVAQRMGISASSLIYNISHDAIEHMAGIMRQVPESGDTDAVVKRLRGDSVSYIQDQYESLMGEMGGDDNASGK